jgi:hypothetical protein
VLCGILSLVGLGCFGLCLAGLVIYLIAGGREDSRSAVVWKMIPLCLMWCLWSERNARCFDNSSRTLEELNSFFLHYFVLLDGYLVSPLSDKFF